MWLRGESGAPAAEGRSQLAGGSGGLGGAPPPPLSHVLPAPSPTPSRRLPAATRPPSEQSLEGHSARGTTAGVGAREGGQPAAAAHPLLSLPASYHRGGGHAGGAAGSGGRGGRGGRGGEDGRCWQRRGSAAGGLPASVLPARCATSRGVIRLVTPGARREGCSGAWGGPAPKRSFENCVGVSCGHMR